MKLLKWIVWGSIAVAVILILMAGISLVFNMNIVGTGHVVNFIHAANCFLLLSIALYVVTDKLACCCKTKEEK